MIFVCETVEVPESGDEVLDEPPDVEDADEGEEFVTAPVDDVPVTSRSIPMALSSFSLSCRDAAAAEVAATAICPLSSSPSLLQCNRLHNELRWS